MTSPNPRSRAADQGEPRLVEIWQRHALLTAEKIRALFDNIRGKKDRIIDGEVVKKDDGDG